MMLNFENLIFRLITATTPPHLFYNLVPGNGPPNEVKFGKELIGALIGNLDALIEQVFFSLIRYF
jgi:hypothetical protein